MKDELRNNPFIKQMSFRTLAITSIFPISLRDSDELQRRKKLFHLPSNAMIEDTCDKHLTAKTTGAAL